MRALLLAPLLVLAALPLAPGADAARIACTAFTPEPCDGWVCTHWDAQQQRYTRCIPDPFVVCVTDPCPPQLPNPEDWLP